LPEILRERNIQIPKKIASLGSIISLIDYYSEIIGKLLKTQSLIGHPSYGVTLSLNYWFRKNWLHLESAFIPLPTGHIYTAKFLLYIAKSETSRFFSLLQKTYLMTFKRMAICFTNENAL